MWVFKDINQTFGKEGGGKRKHVTFFRYFHVFELLRFINVSINFIIGEIINRLKYKKPKV